MKDCEKSKHHGAYPVGEDCPWCETPKKLVLTAEEILSDLDHVLHIAFPVKGCTEQYTLRFADDEEDEG